jgi:hypothetical protein
MRIIASLIALAVCGCSKKAEPANTPSPTKTLEGDSKPLEEKKDVQKENVAESADKNANVDGELSVSKTEDETVAINQSECKRG